MPRICRVAPDLTAIERVFDYVVPEPFAPLVRVGSVVRVPLHGRRVRGWVVEDHVESEAAADKLLDVLSVSSDGPPADVVDLADWIAWRWSGPRIAVLRSASPPNNAKPSRVLEPSSVQQVVAPGSILGVESASSDLTEPGPATQVRRNVIVRRPPLADRRELVASMCAAEGSTLIAVADGSRARAIAQYLQRNDHNVAFVHSDVADAQRTEAWRRAARGKCVVVGGRTAALAPVPDLAAAIVVDDADEALQEERSPTWHARDVLYERARRAEASWSVVSPAPTIEAIALADGKLDAPPADVETRGWPRVLVVDRREEPPGAGLLTDAFATAVRDANGPVVCVLNRRGRLRVLACDSCRALMRWDRGEERPMICDSCGATRLRVLRAGVTRVREELEALFPRLRVLDVDAATTEIGAADILIGTEAVLHRPEIRRRRPTLVAFMDLDQELLAPRYRAAAQAHWLTTRGAQLLTGRPRHETRLLVQTRQAEHEVVRALVAGRPDLVTAAESPRREALGFPPFGALAELAGEEPALLATIEVLRGLEVASAVGRDVVQVLGPTDGRALVVAPTSEGLADALAIAHAAGRANGRVRIVVDPPRV